MTNITTKPAYIGMDVSSDKLDIYVLQTQEHFVIPNDETSLREWVTTVGPRSFIVLESTGGYERLARHILAEHDIPCHRAHPNKVHNFAKYKGLKAKTDRIDAQILALYGKKEEVKPSLPQEPMQEELCALVTRRSQLSDMITAEKNRNNKALHPIAAESVQRTLEILEKEKKDIEKRIRDFIKSSPQLKKSSDIMISLKGVGPTTIMIMLAALPQLGHVTRNQISAFVGLAPYNNDSGKRTGRRTISGGRFDVRKVLYMAAVTAIRYNKIMKAYYERLRDNGKCFKVAIVAVMRKMLITLNQMMAEQKKWKYADF